jgi:hypothetical protein
MPPTLSGAFEQAVLAVLGDPKRYLDQPGGLDELMRGLDTASAAAYGGKPSLYSTITGARFTGGRHLFGARAVPRRSLRRWSASRSASRSAPRWPEARAGPVE